MVEYECKKCNKKFNQKSHYTSHCNRKTPCVSEEQLRQLVKEELKKQSENRPTAVDLFSGAGGMTQGFVDAGVKILFGVEFDKNAALTYSANFEHPMLNEDICKLNADELVEKHGQVDIVFGGPPCQGFSMAGKRDKKDPRNSLFMEYLRFVKAFNPKYFVMENVPGILTMKTESNELVKDIIESEVNKLGYNLKYKKLYAPDYGVPQKRKRVIFLGWRNDVKEPFHPEPSHIPDNYVGTKEILLPREEVDAKYYHSKKMVDGIFKRLERNREAGKGFGAQFIKEDEPCYTISARYYKDGCDALVKYSDTEIRKLTEKEAARVQTFPDSFKFPVSSVQTYKQIGNAVPCRLANAIANSVLKVLHS
jgi:DNA (cytosine-5)-methyltransferase 1